MPVQRNVYCIAKDASCVAVQRVSFSRFVRRSIWLGKGGARAGFTTARIATQPQARCENSTSALAQREEAARQDAARRSEKAAQRSAKLDVQRRYEAAQRMLLALSQECETVVRAALAEAGYYQHNRGEWRRYARNHDK